MSLKKIIEALKNCEPDKALIYAEKFTDELHEENKQLRMLLWLRHGCDGLYGDDGEMQCAKCMIDFKRDSADSIEEKWHTAGEKALIKHVKDMKL